MSLSALSLTEAAADIREGRVTSTELGSACLERIGQVDGDIQAWTFLDRDHVLGQAAVCDARAMPERPQGCLRGRDYH